MTRLSAVRAALLEELGDSAQLHFINTRLILTVGVNLNAPDAITDADPKSIEKTVAALQKMGFLKGREVRHGA